MTPEQLQMLWLVWFTETLKVLSVAQTKAAHDWRAGMDKVQGPDYPPDFYYGYPKK